MFQFQNGAIISMTDYDIVLQDIMVSIPKWCDYKIVTKVDFMSQWQVSIPKWCDYKMPRCSDLVKIKIVSIPKWCDYKSNKCTWDILTLEFQFQNGAIISIAI